MTEKQALQNLIRRFPDFERWEFSKQLPLIAWFLHRFCTKVVFGEEDVRRCLVQHLDFKPIPLLQVEIYRCPNIVKSFHGYHNGVGYKEEHGYKLNWRTCDKFDKELLRTPTSIQIHQLLKDLPTKIPIAEEKTFLEETLKCYSYGANRAAIVMCWNLAFSHLCYFILKDTSQLAIFNQALHIQFPKKPAIHAYSDFSRLQESDILDLCNSINLLNKNDYKKLKGKLDDRNIAAHPSTVKFAQLDVEHYILDLINNVVLAL